MRQLCRGFGKTWLGDKSLGELPLRATWTWQIFTQDGQKPPPQEPSVGGWTRVATIADISQLILLWYPLSLPQSEGTSPGSQCRGQLLGGPGAHPLQNLCRGSHVKHVNTRCVRIMPDLRTAAPPQEHLTWGFPGPCLQRGFSSSPCIPKRTPSSILQSTLKSILTLFI